MVGGRAALPRPHRPARGARPARRAHPAAGRAHRPPRPDRVPLDRRRRDLDRGVPAPGVPHRRAPGPQPAQRCSGSRPGHADEPGVWYAGGLAAGPVPHRGRRRHVGPGRRLERPPDVGDLVGVPRGEHARRLDAALGHRRPPRRRPPLPRAVRGRRVREHRRRARTGRPSTRTSRPCFLPEPDAEFGHDPHCVRLHPADARPALPAEPLRHLPHRPPGDALGAHRRQHAPRGRRHRLPDRAAPPRPRHRLGVPDGRHRRLAAHQPRRPARPSTSPATPGPAGPARTTGLPGQGVVHGEAPGDDHRRRRPRRGLLRHHQRRGVGQRRRGRLVDLRSWRTCPEIYTVESGRPAG